MADKKITALTELNATGKVAATDLLHIIDYSASPVNKKITVANLFSNVNAAVSSYGAFTHDFGPTNAISGLSVVIPNATPAASAETEVVVNDDGNAFVDFIVNGENTNNMLRVDASADAVGIGIAAPATGYMLDIGEVGSGATGKSLQCAGGADIGGNSTVTGSLGVTGATTLTGDLTSTGKVMTSTVAHSAAGALPLTARTILLSVSGTVAYTLPNGTAGQHLTIVVVAAASTPDGTVSPVSSNFSGFATLDCDAVGEAFELLYVNSKWHILSHAIGGIT